MNANKKLQILGRGALLLSTLIWGTSFFILKNTLDYVPTLYVLAFRFCGAAVLLFLFSIRELKKIDKGYLIAGLFMGLTLLAAYIVQTYGLALTTPGKNAFLTSSYCVIAPLLGWALYKKRPDRYNVAASIVCIIGIGFICLERDLSVNTGDLLTLCCGVFFAMQILVIENTPPVAAYFCSRCYSLLLRACLPRFSRFSQRLCRHISPARQYSPLSICASCALRSAIFCRSSDKSTPHPRRPL